eukprot:tig00020554_g10910.t1
MQIGRGAAARSTTGWKPAGARAPLLVHPPTPSSSSCSSPRSVNSEENNEEQSPLAPAPASPAAGLLQSPEPPSRLVRRRSAPGVLDRELGGGGEAPRAPLSSSPARAAAAALQSLLDTVEAHRLLQDVFSPKQAATSGSSPKATSPTAASGGGAAAAWAIADPFALVGGARERRSSLAERRQLGSGVVNVPTAPFLLPARRHSASPSPAHPASPSTSRPSSPAPSRPASAARSRPGSAASAGSRRTASPLYPLSPAGSAPSKSPPGRPVSPAAGPIGPALRRRSSTSTLPPPPGEVGILSWVRNSRELAKLQAEKEEALMLLKGPAALLTPAAGPVALAKSQRILEQRREERRLLREAAAVVVAGAWLAHRARRELERRRLLRASALAIQNTHQPPRQREVRAVRRLQAFWRRLRTRRVAIVARAVRIACRRFRERREGAQRLLASLRARAAARTARAPHRPTPPVCSRLQTTGRAAAAQIQRAWRRRRAREARQGRGELARRAAARIQAAARMRLAVREAEWWRFLAYRLRQRRIMWAALHFEGKGTASIGAWLHRVRRLADEAAARLQMAWRRYCLARRCAIRRLRYVRLARRWRRRARVAAMRKWLSRWLYARARSALALQCVFRRHLCRRVLRPRSSAPTPAPEPAPAPAPSPRVRFGPLGPPPPPRFVEEVEPEPYPFALVPPAPPPPPELEPAVAPTILAIAIGLRPAPPALAALGPPPILQITNPSTKTVAWSDEPSEEGSTDEEAEYVYSEELVQGPLRGAGAGGYGSPRSPFL